VAAEALSGVLVVDKPAGPTSFEVVERVRRALHAKKAGHAGTLDPLATGVLVVCLGEAVRLQQFFTDSEKAYTATVGFGARTETEDREGRVLSQKDPSALTAEAVRACLGGLTGDIDQVPPMYSAVRVAGKRLYEAARAGEEVLRHSRRVHVDTFLLSELEPPGGAIRRGTFLVRCSKGTYVRTLAADLGELCGVPAHLLELRRTEASGFGIGEALPLEEVLLLAREGMEALRGKVIPLAASLRGMREARLTEEGARALAQGRFLEEDPLLSGKVRAVDPRGKLIAVCEAREGKLRPVRVFP